MNYRWIENIDEFRDIAGEWDAAVMSSASPSPFYLSDFILTWWDHFKDRFDLRIFVLRDEKGIAAGLPLYREGRKLKSGFIRVLRYVGGVAANYTEPLYASDDVRILPYLEEALSGRSDWDALHLTDVRGENPLIVECRTGPHRGRVSIALLKDHMNLAIDLSCGKEAYRSNLSKKMLRDLRSKRRYAEKHYGAVRLTQIKGKKEVGALFDLYTDFSLKSFSERDRKSSFRDKRYAFFLKDFFMRMEEGGRLDAHALMTGDKVLAISFAYRFGHGFNWVLTGFDYEYRYVRPGYLLIEELVDEIVRRRETYYNWYGHAIFYKSQWCNAQSPLFQAIFLNRTIGGMCYNISQRVRSSLRSNARLKRLVRKALNPL